MGSHHEDGKLLRNYLDNPRVHPLALCHPLYRRLQDDNVQEVCVLPLQPGDTSNSVFLGRYCILQLRRAHAQVIGRSV